MKRRKLRFILLPLLLVIIAALLFCFDVFSSSRMVASTPVYDNPSEELQPLETIADETTPLTGQEQPAQPIAVASVMVRTNAPAQTGFDAEVIVLDLVSETSPIVEAPVSEEPVTEAPAQEEPAEEEPTQEEPTQEEPAPVESTTATRMLERANTLIAQFSACANSAEKRALLGITNSNFSNDSFRKKILADMGGSWEQLETDVVEATEYQQDKTLYVQVYIAGKSTSYEPVVYTTQFSDLSGSQWSTNLVYDDDTAAWMEYTKKHEYNNSRVGYSLAGLNGKEGALDELKDTMETSDVWQEVVLPDETDTTMVETPADVPETDAAPAPEA